MQLEASDTPASRSTSLLDLSVSFFQLVTNVQSVLLTQSLAVEMLVPWLTHTMLGVKWRLQSQRCSPADDLSQILLHLTLLLGFL